MKRLKLQLMQGLGDTLLTRIIIKEMAKQFDLQLVTPWPQLFAAIEHVEFIFPDDKISLRTQKQNAYRSIDVNWAREDKTLNLHQLSYTRDAQENRNTFAGLEESAMRLGFKPPVAYEPDLPAAPVPRIWLADHRYVVVRPVTVRTEWLNESRNCRPEYLWHLVERFKALGYRTVMVAHIDGEVESAVGVLPEADHSWTAGQFNVLELMGLVAGASAVLTPGGWGLIAGALANVPTVCVLGGRGKLEGPGRILDRRLIRKAPGFMFPDNYCQCDAMRHPCDKTISNLDWQFDGWLLRHNTGELAA